MKTTALLFVLFGALLTSARADQFMRATIQRSDAVVLGRVLQLTAGQDLDLWEANYPAQPHTHYPGTLAKIQVLDLFFGHSASVITVAFPVSLPLAANNLRSPFQFKENSLGIFFLQSPNKDGVFRQARDLQAIWRIPGADMAPITWSNGAFISIETADHDTNLSPLVRMADLFAHNAVLPGTHQGIFLHDIADLTPDQADAFGIGSVRETPGEDKVAAKRWLDSRLPGILSSKTPEDRLNLDALRVYWGERDLLDLFIDEYMALPETALKVPFPTLSTLDQYIRTMPREHGKGLRMAILGLGAPINKPQRAKCLRAMLQFGGKDDVTVDWAILESAGNLFDRPDWSPAPYQKTKSRPVDKLEEIREFAKGLADTKG